MWKLEPKLLPIAKDNGDTSGDSSKQPTKTGRRSFFSLVGRCFTEAPEKKEAYKSSCAENHGQFGIRRGENEERIRLWVNQSSKNLLELPSLDTAEQLSLQEIQACTNDRVNLNGWPKKKKESQISKMQKENKGLDKNSDKKFDAGLRLSTVNPAETRAAARNHSNRATHLVHKVPETEFVLTEVMSTKTHPWFDFDMLPCVKIRK